MFTLASIPKPFAGATGQAQERAVASWLELGHDVQIVLVGDDEGVSDAASRLQVDHVGGVARNAHGTPRLDDALRRVDGIARHRLRCLVNADIILLPDLIPAVERVASASAQFLLVGQSRDVVVGDDEITAPEALRRRALSSGTTRGPTAIDWFVFPAGLFDPMPPFAIGRAAFDNWLIWRARQAGPVIDATEAVVAIHQPHAYGHLGGGKEEAYYGEEADENRRLAGRPETDLHPARREPQAWAESLPAPESRLDPPGTGDSKESGVEARPAVKVVAVFPEPTPYRAPLLDLVSAHPGIDLVVAYAARTVASRTWEVEVRHRAVYLRGRTLPGARRILRHDYPITPGVVSLLRRERPEVVVTSGWSTFASQAAIVWCRFKRVPYALVVESHDRDHGQFGGERSRAQSCPASCARRPGSS